MNDPRTIRWGIIGCGSVCEVKSGPAFYTTRGSALTLVMRRDAERAADFARRHGVPRHTRDAQAVIDDPEVDAVYIATPPGSHLEHALRVAAAHKPCYVEKPMARNAAEAERMVTAFERARTPLFVAYYRRALPRFIALRTLIEAGTLGTIQAATHIYQRRAPSSTPSRSPGWREDARESGGGLFVDLGSHVVDLLDFLLGPITACKGVAGRRSEEPATAQGTACKGVAGRRSEEPATAQGMVEDTVVAALSFQSGALGSLSYQFAAAEVCDRLELIGSRGTVSCSVFGQEPPRLREGGSERELAAPHPMHVQQPLIETIIGELNGSGAHCPSTGQSALRASVVLDAVLGDYYGGREDEFWLRPHTWPGAPTACAPRCP